MTDKARGIPGHADTLQAWAARARLVIVLVCLAPVAAVHAADPPPAAAPDAVSSPDAAPAGAVIAPAHDDISASLTTLAALHADLEQVRADLTQRRAELKHAPSVEGKAAIEAIVARLEAREQGLQADIEQVATGLDGGLVRGGVIEKFDLVAEVEGLLRPLIEELKEATETPRQIEALRNERAQLSAYANHIATAIRRLELLKAENEDTALEHLLDDSLQKWESERAAVATQIAVTDHNLERRLQDQESFLKSTGDVLGGFFATRGRSILYAIAAFLAMFLLLRLIHKLLRKLVLGGRRTRRTFASRLAYVIFNFMTGILSVSAALVALYSTGDWVLLGITLLLLFGVAWASKNAVVIFFDQIRLLMNVGPVREDELIIYQSVPWKVARLGVFTQLVNPALASGRLRLSSRKVLSLHSRPVSGDVTWFPTNAGEWVRLSDGCYGKVVHQTPDFVEIEKKGGSVVTYETPAFLGQSPENLSRGFRLVGRFGVDYAHQAIATTEIPEKMAARLRQVLLTVLTQGHLKQLAVELEAAGASSLDYAALIDIDGRAAGDYDVLGRLVQRTLVDLCTEQGWNIPFPQLTVHGVDANAL